MSRAGRALLSGLALALGLAGPGCSSTSTGLRFISARPSRDGTDYTVMAVIENTTNARVPLDDLGIEMATYDAAGRLLDRGYQFSFHGDVVGPFATSRLPLHRPDRARAVRTSRLYLKDVRGRVLAETAIGPIDAPEPSPAAAAPAAPPPAAPSTEFPILSAPR